MRDLFGDEHPEPGTPTGVQLSLLDFGSERRALESGRPVSQEKAAIVAPETDEDDLPAEASKPKEHKESKPPKVRPGPVCSSCGMTWEQGCARPDWSWVDLGIIGINTCIRCDRHVCHHCYARTSEAWFVLCPACWDLPAPTLEDAAAHPLAQSREDGVEYAWRYLQQCLWRYEEPRGQCMPINPLLVWYWQQRDDVDEESLSKNDRKVRERRWEVVNGWKEVSMLDRVWLPAWAPALLETLRTAEPAAGWSE